MNDFLTLTFQGITALAAIAVVTITILLNWKYLREFSIFKRVSQTNRKTVSFKAVSRRKFLIISAATTGIVFWALLHYKLAKKKLKNIYDLFFHDNKNLIINNTSGIIHHKMLCFDHLPIEKNRSDSNYDSSKLRFHKSKKVSILDLIAQNRTAEDAIEILLLAAEGNPASLHIYDKLIFQTNGLWGIAVRV